MTLQNMDTSQRRAFLTIKHCDSLLNDQIYGIMFKWKIALFDGPPEEKCAGKTTKTHIFTPSCTNWYLIRGYLLLRAGYLCALENKYIFFNLVTDDWICNSLCNLDHLNLVTQSIMPNLNQVISMVSVAAENCLPANLCTTAYNSEVHYHDIFEDVK